MINNLYWLHKSESLVSKYVCAQSQSCLTLCDSMDYSPLGSSVREIPGKNTGVECCISCSREPPNPGIEPVSPGSPALQADSLLSEPPKKWGNPNYVSVHLLLYLITQWIQSSLWERHKIWMKNKTISTNKSINYSRRLSPRRQENANSLVLFLLS